MNHGSAATAELEASIIVPSYNSRGTILPCLQALEEQRTGQRHEIILVDSSDDGTAELVTARHPRVRLIHLAQRTLPGAARNLGIRAAQGRILAFTDADCVPEPDWLEKLLTAHADGEWAAVGGAVTNGYPRDWVAWSGYLDEFSAYSPRAPRGRVELLPTCNVAFRREVFADHGLFPEDLWPSEDQVFSWQLVQAGEGLLFEPGIQVRHLFRTGLRQFLIHQHRLGKASATARRRLGLPPRWLIQSPLCVLAPLIRLLRIEGRLLRRDLQNFARFNLLLPLCGSGVLCWGVGFVQGCCEQPAEQAVG